MSKADKFNRLVEGKSEGSEGNGKFVTKAHEDFFPKDKKPASTTKTPTAVKKKKFEDEFERSTVYLHKDVKKKLNRKANRRHGGKTKLIDKALRKYLDMPEE